MQIRRTTAIQQRWPAEGKALLALTNDRNASRAKKTPQVAQNATTPREGSKVGRRLLNKHYCY